MSKKQKKTKIQKHQIYRWDFSWYALSCPYGKWQKSENCLKMDIFFLSIWMLQKLSYLIFILWEGVIKDSDNFFFFQFLVRHLPWKVPSIDLVFMNFGCLWFFAHNSLNISSKFNILGSFERRIPWGIQKWYWNWNLSKYW